MTVKATQKCFVGGRIRRPGEEFEHPATSAKDLPPFLEPVKGSSTRAPKKEE